jgi:hypothetical protein
MYDKKPNTQDVKALATVLEELEKVDFIYLNMLFKGYKSEDNEWRYEIYHIENVPKDDEENYLINDVEKDDELDSGLCTGSTYNAIMKMLYQG